MRVVMLLMIMVRMDVFMLTMLARMIVTVEVHVPTVHMIMGVFINREFHGIPRPN